MNRVSAAVSLLVSGTGLAAVPVLNVSLPAHTGPRLEWAPAGAGLVLESSARLGDAWTALLGGEVVLTTNGPTVRAVDLRPAADTRFYRLRGVSPVGPVGGLAYDVGNLT